jgi:hypothetical protein
MTRTTHCPTLFAVSMAVVIGCLSPRRYEPPDSSDAEAADGRDGSVVTPDVPTSNADVAPSSSGCATGSHECPGLGCVSDNSVDHCGPGCQPCPNVAGGTRTCDGKQCGGQCPAGKKLCLGECLSMDAPCEGTCPTGSHSCGGLCAPNTSTLSCGTACSACAAPAGGRATCDGSKCGFTCDQGKKCTDRCGECCGVDDCSPQAGRVATCDQSSLRCRYTCPGGNKDCNGQCIPETSCCRDSDCMPMSGRIGKCDSSTGRCDYLCGTDTKPCGGKCISASGCCDDSACSGNFACVNSTCSTTQCRTGFKPCGATCIASNGCCEDRDCGGDFACVGSVCSKTMCRAGFKNCDGRCIQSNACCGDAQCSGNFACVNNSCSSTQCRTDFKKCGSECIPSGTCCRADGCCAHGDCPLCQKCASGRCVAQATNEDLKSECSAGTCRTGSCNGSGGCGLTPNGDKSSGCDGDCQQCVSGSCGVKTDGDVCGAGKKCRNAQCVVCGALNQDCCPGSSPCNSGLMCRAGQCVTACGNDGQPCCSDRLQGNQGCEAGFRCWSTTGTNLRCQRCGGTHEVCCADANGFFCSNGNLTCYFDEAANQSCEPCGHLNERCCERNGTGNGYTCDEGTCSDFPFFCR